HMATERMIIGAEPVQITDGTNSALISVLDPASISFAESENIPDTATGDFLRDKMTVHPPLKIWVWNSTRKPIPIAVTRW
ncbi:hypothetical protein UXN81_19780, partial [Enterobacter hormaechei]